jgi:hypothetical protein
MVPDYLSSKFTPANVINSYNLRHSDSKLFVPRPLTESLKKSLLVEEPSCGLDQSKL